MIIAEDRKTLRNITAKIKRILKNDIPKIKDEEVQFLLGQAFITVDSFLSKATEQTKKREEDNAATGL